MMGKPPPGAVGGQGVKAGKPNPSGAAEELAESSPASRPSVTAQLSRVWRHGRQLLFRSQPKLTLAYIVLSVLASLAMMIVPQLFAEITNTLQQAAAEKGDAAEVDGKKLLLILFAAWALFLLLIRPLINLAVKVFTTRLDNAVGLDLSRRLFRRVLAMPLPFFHQRDIGSLTYLLRDMCIQAQMAIRQLTVDPVLMLISLLTGLGFVIYNYLQLSGGGPDTGSWLVVAALLLVGLAAPLLVSRFAPGLQSAASDLRDRDSELASLLQGALQSPEELQSFNAVPYMAGKHKDARLRLNRAREQQTIAVEKVNFFNTVPSDLTQVLLVGAAVLLVFASSGVEKIGSLVAILLLVPQLMRPIQGLSSVIVSLKTAWPSIEAVLGYR